MKYVKLSRIEKALITLAEHIELNPLNNYKVTQEILEILGLKKIPEKSGGALK